jgi:tetratricopeptide (TPR) repeat protein
VRDVVDAVIVVDTGATDDTIAIARAAAGDKFVLRHHAWTEDFAGARNASLAIAAELGAQWAVHLDSDERIDFGEADVRAVLRATPHDVLMVGDRWGTYAKQRLYRLPAAGAYVGRTHEAFIQRHGSRGTLEGATFSEIPKDADAFRRKCERDIRILLEVTAEMPNDPRWHYYLGQSYDGLGRHREAIAAFEACAALRGWDEEAGWAMYKAACCWLALDDPVRAVDCCARGMALCPAMAELPWLAGFASWKLGRHQQAVHWSRMAVVLGRFRGSANDRPRHGFQEPRGQWEGPFDVLRFALRALGDEAAADDAERLFASALEANKRGDTSYSARGRAMP